VTTTAPPSAAIRSPLHSAPGTAVSAGLVRSSTTWGAMPRKVSIGTGPNATLMVVSV